MSLASRVVWISFCGLLSSAGCANELPETADDGKVAAGSPASPLVSGGTAGSAPTPGASKPNNAPATAPTSSGSTSQPSQSTTSPAATSGGVGGAGGAGSSAPPAKPAASSGGASAGGSVAAPATTAGSVAAPAAGSGAAGAEALPDLGEILPPLSTPETRVPSPDNPAECPATAPENPIGDCLGLPIYLECNYGTYFCVCDWYHWLCAG